MPIIAAQGPDGELRSASGSRTHRPLSALLAAAATVLVSACSRPLRSRGWGTASRKGRRPKASMRGVQEAA